MKYKIRCILCALCILMLKTTAANAQDQSEPQPISISTTGEMGNRPSSAPSLSGDGRFVAFRSEANNLAEGDTNGVADIFVHDRLNATTARVSISSTGEQADAPVEQPMISANGRVVVFQSTAQTLVPGLAQAENISHIYAYDRLTGITERVSVNHRGESGNGPSRNPSISATGRYVAFMSYATNLVRNDTNNASDVFIHDRLSGHTTRVSVGTRGQEGNANSGEQLAIAADGHTVVFSSQATTLATSFDTVPRLYYHNRVTAETSYVNFPVDEQQRELLQITSSSDAVTFAGLTQLDNAIFEILIFKPYNDTAESLATLLSSSASDPQITLSGDGFTLISTLPIDHSSNQMQQIDLHTTQSTSLAPTHVESVAISQDGQSIAYAQNDARGVAQIYLLSEGQAGLTIRGRVTDALGSPLGFVNIATSNGEIVYSDENGYFFFGSQPPGVTVLTPAKDGYTFEPRTRLINIDATLAEIHFTAYPEKILAEAAKDLGMPYAAERGESGAFHGYAAGYCTDLVLDAYTWGAEFDIQAALEQDYRAQPEHFYNWRDARNAHDMWRYLSYSGQMLAHTLPYLPGDIVFFDLSEDGEIDHVSLVSEIDTQNRPLQMYDATGKINDNPDGLADELRWVEFHERSVRGHARWSGLFEPMVSELPVGTYLQAAVGAALVELRLIDPQGGSLARAERGIPGGTFVDLGWEQSVSVISPRELGENYLVEIHNPGVEAAAFTFLAHTIQDSIVTRRVEYKAVLAPGETLSLRLLLSLDEAGQLVLSVPELETE